MPGLGKGSERSEDFLGQNDGAATGVPADNHVAVLSDKSVDAHLVSSPSGDSQKGPQKREKSGPFADLLSERNVTK